MLFRGSRTRPWAEGLGQGLWPWHFTTLPALADSIKTHFSHRTPSQWFGTLPGEVAMTGHIQSSRPPAVRGQPRGWGKGVVGEQRGRPSSADGRPGRQLEPPGLLRRSQSQPPHRVLEFLEQGQ